MSRIIECYNLHEDGIVGRNLKTLIPWQPNNKTYINISRFRQIKRKSILGMILSKFKRKDLLEREKYDKAKPYLAFDIYVRDENIAEEFNLVCDVKRLSKKYLYDIRKDIINGTDTSFNINQVKSTKSFDSNGFRYGDIEFIITKTKNPNDKTCYRMRLQPTFGSDSDIIDIYDIYLCKSDVLHFLDILIKAKDIWFQKG